MWAGKSFDDYEGRQKGLLNITLPAEFSTSSRAVRPAAGERVYHNVLQPISTLVPYVANYVCRLVNMMRNRSKLIRTSFELVVVWKNNRSVRNHQNCHSCRCVLAAPSQSTSEALQNCLAL